MEAVGETLLYTLWYLKEKLALEPTPLFPEAQLSSCHLGRTISSLNV